MAIRCAILDDYQNVALKLADWGKVKDRVEIKVFQEHLGGPDKVIAALQGLQIIVAMRERTALMGGVFRISGRKGKGTVVSIEVPVAPKAAEAHGGQKTKVVR